MSDHSTSSTPTSNSYSWTVPAAASTNVFVRITDVDDSSVSDVSDAAFTISVVKTLTITVPNGGEVYSPVTGQTITWTYTGSITNVQLEYSSAGAGGPFTVITASTSAAAGSFGWNTPVTSSANYYIRITDVDDTSVTDLSDAPFTIL